MSHTPLPLSPPPPRPWRSKKLVLPVSRMFLALLTLGTLHPPSPARISFFFSEWSGSGKAAHRPHSQITMKENPFPRDLDVSRVIPIVSLPSLVSCSDCCLPGGCAPLGLYTPRLITRSLFFSVEPIGERPQLRPTPPPFAPILSTKHRAGRTQATQLGHVRF